MADQEKKSKDSSGQKKVDKTTKKVQKVKKIDLGLSIAERIKDLFGG